MSDCIKQNYNKGENMIQKMGSIGIGPIGANGEGIWNPFAIPAPPKCQSKLVIGLSHKIEDDSSRKVKNIILLLLKVIRTQNLSNLQIQL